MLSDLDRAVLDLAAKPWKGRGWLEREARDRLGLSSIRFYQRLDALVRTREAIEYDPITCRRIRELAA
ncbi:DUF3263 domain-containing protein [Agrococcus sp. Marseille-Q4369]|uniref:DUF3263 domain-containing protein n=1 Tax=Agrococcus sp. Marseille-Q4369 TaxID=2810513 RepID=UPI001B8D8952|nr:DUF3263 domain-containing protein [Agrococcus sp. Marseille-Q4369]QUW18911.1 DUF3263 domain-containing protein [Agrococcus sp. Marseille-Q4369]